MHLVTEIGAKTVPLAQKTCCKLDVVRVIVGFVAEHDGSAPK